MRKGFGTISAIIVGFACGLVTLAVTAFIIIRYDAFSANSFLRSLEATTPEERYGHPWPRDAAYGNHKFSKDYVPERYQHDSFYPPAGFPSIRVTENVPILELTNKQVAKNMCGTNLKRANLW